MEPEIHSTGKLSDRYLTTLSNGRHTILADEPEDLQGTDLGFSPDELLAAALTACTSITLRMYAARKEISFDTLHVSTRLELSKEGNVFFRTIAIEPPVSADEQVSLLRIAEKCPVHKTLENSNTINTIFL